MSRLFLLPWILVLFCGCIIVKSDATRVDPETGAIHVDLTHSEDPEEADDPEEEDDDLDEGTVSTQRDKSPSGAEGVTFFRFQDRNSDV